MPTNIDELQIEINAQATKANDAIDRLVLKLDRLTTSLGRMNTTNLNGLANGVQRLGNAMQIMNGVRTADFTRLATNLQRLGAINVSSLNSAASSMSHLTRAFNNLGTVSNNAQQVGVMAGNLARLGGANVQRAVTTIPQLATAMNNLMTTLSRAPQVSQNVIQLTNSLANLASQGSRVGTATDSINRNLNSTNRTVRSSRSSWGGFASVIGRFYASCFLAIRGINALGESIKDTADYFEAYNYFNVALGKIGSDWEDDFSKYGYNSAEAYADSFATRLQDKLSTLSGLQISSDGMLETTGMKNLGLNIQEITQFSAQLASVTNSVGQVGEVSLATSSAFTKLAGDMSSLFNMDYSQVATNLQSGLIGQSRALYKYGIDITNATLQTYAYELGVEKAVSEMTQAEKQQLRIIAILDQSRVAWTDQANTINSLANQMRILENNMSEISLVLGQLFVPLMENALPVVNGLTKAIKNLLVNLAGILGIEIDPNKFGQGFTEIEDELDGITEGTEEAEKALEEYKNQLLGFDEVNKLQDVDAKATLDTEQTGGIDLTEEILDATEEYEKFWQQAYDKMEDYSAKWEEFFDRIFRPVKDVLGHLKYGYDMDFESFGGDLFGISTEMTEWFNDALAKIDWSGIGYRFGQFFEGTASESFNNLGNTGTTITNIVTGINTFIARAIDSVDWKKLTGDLIQGVTKFLKNLDINKILQTLTDVGNSVNSMFTEIFEYVLENPDEIAGLIAQIFGKVFELAIGLPAVFGENLGNLLGGVIQTYVENAIDKAKEGLITGNKFGKSIGQAIEDGAKAWKDGEFIEWLSGVLKDVFGNAWEKFSSWFEETPISSWWQRYSEMFSMEKFRDTMGSIKEAFKRRWNSLDKWFNGTAMGEWWTKFKENFKAEKWESALGGVKTGFEKAFNNAVNAIKTIWNKFADSLNAKLTFTIEAFNNPFTGQPIWSDISVNLGKIPKFWTGGFPEDGLFFANHNELVGKFANGRTAVANNYQIEAGIEQASYRGMARALAEHQVNGGIAEVKLVGDADGLFEVIQSKADNYTMQTGRPAFII